MQFKMGVECYHLLVYSLIKVPTIGDNYTGQEVEQLIGL